MSITTPGERVDAPACVPTRYGLLSVAEIEDRDDGHWGLGFHHEELGCTAGETRILSCPPDNEPKNTDSSLSYPQSDPFTVIVPFKCATSKDSLARAWDLAEKQMAQNEQRLVEEVFWSGFDAQGNSVRQALGGENDVVDLTPVTGAVEIGTGVALLESWAGENMACQPIIHGQRAMGTYYAERDLVAANGEVLSMIGTGSRVAVGGGYRATGPQGAVPGGTFATDDGDPLNLAVQLDNCVDGLMVDWGDGNGREPLECPATPGHFIVHGYDVDDTYQVTITGPYGYELGPVTITTATDETQHVQGSGTPAVADGEGWLFVTGAVKLVRGPVFFTPNRDDVAAAVDREKNDITVFAERNYGIEYQCGVAAVRVLLRTAYC